MYFYFRLNFDVEECSQKLEQAGYARVGSVVQPQTASSTQHTTAASATSPSALKVNRQQQAEYDHQPQLRSSQQATRQQARSRSSTGATTTDHSADEFSVLQLKSQFSEVPDSLIREVLLSAHNNSSIASQSLKNMGYEDGDAVEERLRRLREETLVKQREEEDEKRRQQREKEKVTSRLSAEFPFTSGGRLTQLLTEHQFDYDKAKQQLLVMEKAHELAAEFDLTDDVVDRLVNSVNMDIVKVRRQIENELHANQNGQPTPAGRQSHQNQISPGYLSEMEVAVAPQEDVCSFTCSHVPPRYHSNGVALVGSSSKFARGPNPANCKGPNRSLLTLKSDRYTAVGPNSFNCEGSLKSGSSVLGTRAQMTL